MGAFFGKEELENLRSLKHDLLDPVKSFSQEVYRDTVGDAGNFYADKARKAQRGMKLTQEKTKARMAAIRREQEEMKRRRKATMKRAAITLAVLALISLIIISAALSAHAAEQQKWELPKKLPFTYGLYMEGDGASPSVDFSLLSMREKAADGLKPLPEGGRLMLCRQLPRKHVREEEGRSALMLLPDVQGVNLRT